MFGNQKVYLHKANLDLSLFYPAPVTAATEIVAQLGRGNCRIEDMRALYYQVAERFRKMRHGEEEKERRAKKREQARANQTPVQTEKSKRHIAIRKFAERYAMPYADAREELTKFWEENPEEKANFELPQYVTDEQLEQAERLAVKEASESSPDRLEPEPVQPVKTREQIEFELNRAMCEAEDQAKDQAQEKARALAQGKRWND